MKNPGSLLVLVYIMLSVINVPESSASSECPDVDNLLANCGFDADILSWSSEFNAFVSHSTADANTGPGSMQIEMEGLKGQSNWSANSECVVLTADQNYRYGGWFRYLSGTNPNFCHAQLRVYPGVSDCTSGSSTEFGSGVSLTTDFQKSSGTFTAGASGDSAEIHLRCQGGAAGTQILVDDVFVGLDTSLDLESDLGITKDNGVDMIIAGAMVTYTIVATNSGPDDAVGVHVSDPLPPDTVWTCAGSDGGVCGAAKGNSLIEQDVDLPVGGSVTFSATFTTDQYLVKTLENTAMVTPPLGTIDLNSNNDSATDSDGVTQEADLMLTKSNGVDSVVAGEEVSYTIVVTNIAGPSGAPEVLVNDIFPEEVTGVDWTCSGTGGGSCAASGSGEFLDETVNLPASATVTFIATGTVAPRHWLTGEYCGGVATGVLR